MSSPSKEGKPPKLPLSLILALHPAKIDAFLAHLHRCLQTPAGIDTVLLFVGYSSRLASALLTSAPSTTLQASARALLANLVTDAAKIPNPNTTQVARSLRTLSDLMSEFRMFTRLWSLLGLYFSLKGLVRKELAGQGARQGAFDRAVPWLQVGSCVALQVLENGAYLAMKGVLPWKRATIMRAFAWSSRFFAAYVGLELGKLVVEKIRRERGEVAEKEADWRAQWNRSLVKSLAWAPLTVHWSLEKGLVGDMAVGALATIPGVIGMSKLWRDTA